MNYRAQKTALTRAINSGDKYKVMQACVRAVREWNNESGFWPDDWSRWQRALYDSGFSATLEELA